MGLFDLLKRKKEEKREESFQTEYPRSPTANTMQTVLFDRTVLDRGEMERTFVKWFGADAIQGIDDSRQGVTHFMLQIQGVEVVCSYMAFPFPKEEGDLSLLFGFSHYISEEEQAALANSESFCLVTQIGEGAALEGKRRACLTVTRVCGVLLGMEGAAGVYYNMARLLLGRKMYLHYAAITEQELENPDHFPSMLWILVCFTRAEDGAPTVETRGLNQFGFLELQFYKPREEWAQSYEKLYLLSMLEITGKEVYRNMDTISFTEDKISVFKKVGEKLSVIGGI